MRVGLRVVKVLKKEEGGESAAPDSKEKKDEDTGDGVEWHRIFKAVLTFPFNVLVTVPFALARADGRRQPALFFALRDEALAGPSSRALAGLGLQAAAAGGLFAVGSLLLVRTNRLFARARGTLAPWDPPRGLVVEGPYRHVRNPMLSGVIAISFGEVLVTRSCKLLGFACAFCLANTAYFIGVEEPELRRRFGPPYDKYLRRVPRWVPRLTPYDPDKDEEGGEEAKKED